MILGVTVDRRLNFRLYVADVKARAKNRLNVMKALASTTFGHSQKTVMALY